MGWELTIVADTAKVSRPLGRREEVCAHLGARLPGLRLAPVPQAFADHMKARLRELGLPYTPMMEGCYEAPDFTIEFHCADAETIPKISIVVRGRGDALPALRSLCAGTAWVAIDDASGKSILRRDDQSA